MPPRRARRHGGPPPSNAAECSDSCAPRTCRASRFSPHGSRSSLSRRGRLAATWGTLLVVPSLIAHGAVLAFAYAISHEGAHGTAFRSRWLNESVFYLTSFIFGEEPMYRRFSHGRHHAATWYPGFDSQMPYRNPITRARYARETVAVIGMLEGLVQMIRHARGNLTSDEREFVPRARVRQLIWGRNACSCWLCQRFRRRRTDAEQFSARGVLRCAQCGRVGRAAVHQFPAHVHERGGAGSSTLHAKSRVLFADTPALLEYELSHRASPVSRRAFSCAAGDQQARA